jgi:predicted HTH domain antitoxin
MLSSKIILVLIILNAQNIVSLASIVELASDEIDDFIKTLDTRVIYFETKGTQ